MLEQCKKEVHSDDAKREIAAMETAVRYYRALTKRLDKDDKIIGDAIQLATDLRQTQLVNKLKSLRQDTVPYEAMIA